MRTPSLNRQRSAQWLLLALLGLRTAGTAPAPAGGGDYLIAS